MNRPNILLITTDQQRFDTLGDKAPAFLRTPNLDTLSHRGTRFDAAYADCPICVPSRVTIMTGKPAAVHGMMGNGKSSSVIDSADTLPAHLGRMGYHTFGVGKMHFHPQRARHGFDEILLLDDFFREMEATGSPTQPMRSGLSQTGLDATLSTAPETMTSTWWIAQKSAEFIRRRRDPTRPFFLWTSFSKPHPPFDPPEPYYSMYRNCDIPPAAIGSWVDGQDCPTAFRQAQQAQSYDLLGPEKIREARSAYYGLITQVDHAIGRILEALCDGPDTLLDNTLILFTSDHGEYLGDHRAGNKKYFHDVSSRIPMLVCLPASWASKGWGDRVSVPVTLADLMPSLLHCGGDTPHTPSESLSLIDLCRGTATVRREWVIGAGFDSGMVTNGKWKYIYWLGGGVEQLFHLETDPHECSNLTLSPQHADMLRSLREIFVASEEALAAGLVKEGNLQSKPPKHLPEQAIRSQSYMGYSSECSDEDVRH